VISQLHRSSFGASFARIALMLIMIASLGFMGGSPSRKNAVPGNGDSLKYSPYVWALEFGVSNVKRAVDFYTEALGFEVEENGCCTPMTVLRNGKMRVLLHRVDAAPADADMAGVYLNMRVGDIARIAGIAQRQGAFLNDASPRPFALGQAMTIRDPFGNKINLLDIADDTTTATSRPAVFNVGVLLETLERGEGFYTNLGFQVYSRDYLPDLPYQRHGVVALVLHGDAKAAAHPGRRNGTIVLATPDLQSAIHALQTRGFTVEQHAAVSSAQPGVQLTAHVEGSSRSGLGFAILHDPSGNLLKLIELDSQLLTAANGTSEDAKAASPAALAQAGFERFKKLDGQWLGRSTKGWEETIGFKTIAKGSVVVKNSFDAHPNETMMTMFHLDGGRLMLTHYCVAGNQPRLEATAFENDGRTVTFTFIDATNLPSRDKGHMDKAVFRFIDDNKFSSQWTWYQDGKESWMEEIVLERKH
jgi:predicted enzyme related to lactoylglutathione lyase